MPANGDIELIVGRTRSGKTCYVRRRLDEATRVIVWDPKDEYGDLIGNKLTNGADVLAMVNGDAPAKVRFVPTGDEPVLFQRLCSAAIVLAFDHGRPLTFVAEELSQVTPPGKAPRSWGKLLRQGRGKGVTVLGVTQRPQESDKTIVSNQNIIHCCALGRADDRRYMEKEMDLPAGALDRLEATSTHGDFVHLEDRAPVFGRLTFATGEVRKLDP